jgi:hypothetical protein
VTHGRGRLVFRERLHGGRGGIERVCCWGLAGGGLEREREERE